MPMRFSAFFLLMILGTTAACSSNNDSSGPCAMSVVMSCDDGDSCHEFYSQEAADAVRGDCVALGATISSSPCAKSYSDCCVTQKGSFGNPEGACLSSGGWSNSCKETDETLCKR